MLGGTSSGGHDDTTSVNYLLQHERGELAYSQAETEFTRALAEYVKSQFQGELIDLASADDSSE